MKWVRLNTPWRVTPEDIDDDPGLIILANLSGRLQTDSSTFDGPGIWCPHAKDWHRLEANGGEQAWIIDPLCQHLDHEQEWIALSDFEASVLRDASQAGGHLALEYLIWKLNSPAQNNTSQKGVEKSLVEKVESYFKSHLSDRIQLKDVALALNCSTVSIHKAFRNKGSKTAMERLMDLRMKRAKDTIEHSDVSLKVLAKELGFSESASFSRCFKRYFGRSPRQHRQDCEWLN
jgi:AraC-like DNA-binding protein